MSGFDGQDYDDDGRPVADNGILWLDQVEAERVSWLWRGRLPLGKLAILDGDPGVGKSTLVIDWIARLTTGTDWPDGAPCRKGNALIMSAEDGAADTIRPRLDAADGNAGRVALWTDVPFTDSDGIRHSRPPLLPDDVDTLEQKIRDTSAKLVMIDVLMAYLSSQVNAHKDQDIRSALHRLSRVAERTGCCVVILRHLNKSGGNNAIYRGGGSIGIIGQARAAFIAARDPSDETGNTRVLACSKMNIATEPPSLAYTLEDSEQHGCARVRWGDAINRTAADLLGDSDSEPGELNDAVGWLQGYLIDVGGEAASTDVKTAARKCGIYDRTLQRARKKAGVTSRNEGWPRKTIWVLDFSPEEQDQPRQSRQPSEVGATGDKVVSSPQVGNSRASHDTFSRATDVGTTVGWPEDTIGAAENKHDESLQVRKLHR